MCPVCQRDTKLFNERRTSSASSPPQASTTGRFDSSSSSSSSSPPPPPLSEEENYDDIIDDGDEEMLLNDAVAMVKSGLISFESCAIYQVVVEAGGGQLGLSLRGLNEILDNNKEASGVGIAEILSPNKPLLARCKVADQLLYVQDSTGLEHDCEEMKKKDLNRLLVKIKKPFILHFKTTTFTEDDMSESQQNGSKMDDDAHIEHVKAKHSKCPENQRWKNIVQSTREKDVDFYRITKEIDEKKKWARLV